MLLPLGINTHNKEYVRSTHMRQSPKQSFFSITPVNKIIAALPFVVLVALPVLLSRKLFLAVWRGTESRAWDGAGTYRIRVKSKVFCHQRPDLPIAGGTPPFVGKPGAHAVAGSRWGVISDQSSVISSPSRLHTAD